jgi:hypothetical protein
VTANSKSWIYILAALGVVILLLYIANTEKVPPNSEALPNSIPEAAPIAPPAPVAPVVTATPTEVPSSSYELHQPFSIGYWSYLCNSLYWTPILGGFSPESAERANASFLVINIEVRNDDTSASTLPMVQLVDEQGRTYESSSAGMMSQGFFSVFEKLNPGVSKRANIAFDVPPDRHYSLVVSGGIESRKQAIVKLPMPVFPTPAQ